jgi:hypothetical protein
MTPQRAAKHVQRALRAIPVDAVAPRVAAEERDGLWCLVADGLEFVPADGGTCETCWDDPLEYAQFARYVQARPERVHPSRASALAFVRSRLGWVAPDAEPGAAADPAS